MSGPSRQGPDAPQVPSREVRGSQKTEAIGDIFSKAMQQKADSSQDAPLMQAVRETPLRDAMHHYPSDPQVMVGSVYHSVRLTMLEKIGASA